MATILSLGALTLGQAQQTPKLEALIGYHFHDETLLRAALTHASFTAAAADYQRLEFLGDRVLNLVVADALYRRFPDEKEGPLAARLSLLVRAETCAQVGEALGLEAFIIVGHIERRNGVQRMPSVQSDVVEGLIGALFLDGGLDVAQNFILKNWDGMLVAPPSSLKDAKTFVQEWALGQGLALPYYEVLEREGAQHAPRFTVGLRVGVFALAEGTGKSKQMAEKAAAQAFIARQGLRT